MSSFHPKKLSSLSVLLFAGAVVFSSASDPLFAQQEAPPTPEPTTATTEIVTPPDPAPDVSETAGPRPDFTTDFSPVTQPASVDESLVTSTIFVDAAATEAGDGSQEAPFQTIASASAEIVKRLASEPGIKLSIAPGHYREDLSNFLRLKQSSDAIKNGVLVIEGAADGSTVISGSVLEFQGTSFQPPAWQPVADQPGLYVANWPFAWTPDPGPWVRTFGHPEIIGATARREALVIDGEPMRLLAIEKWHWEKTTAAPGAHAGGRSLDGKLGEGKMTYTGLETEDVATFLNEPGTFTVISNKKAPEALRGKIYVRLPEGKTMEDVGLIEIPMVWHEDAPLMRIAWKSNLVIRNVSFTQANGGYLTRALLVVDGENIVIENCRFDNNTNGGLTLQRVNRVTLRKVSASHNGQSGISASGNQFLIEDCETSYNNIRGQWTNFLRWDPAGIKLGGAHGVHFLRHRSIGNFAGGIWWDVYCSDILVEKSLAYGNARLGVEMELSEPKAGNYEIRNSLAARNGGTGIFVSMAANTRVLNNILVNNGGGTLESQKPNTQLCYKVREHRLKGPKSAEDWVLATVQNNLMASQNSAHLINFLTERVDPAKQFPYVLRVLDANRNQYWTAAADAAFVRPDLTFVGLDGWRALLAEYEAPGAREADSVWLEPIWSENPADEFTSRSQSTLTQLARALGVPLDDAALDVWFKKYKAGEYSNLGYR